ncbi:DUF4145 domain-containing protein [Vibrio parahaemolyticus]|uniref:DUF4145 domain-containing protein n=1 Tax=Vibrio parahaemolyticus TaxID=670 RepID=UPI0038924373
MEKIKARCNACQNDTWHHIVHQHQKNMSDEWNLYYLDCQLVECCGCESVRLRTVETSDVCERTDDGAIIPEVKLYPQNVFRQRPKWINHLMFPFSVDTGFSNVQITQLIHEIYVALDGGCYRLAVMGIRALMETVMIQKVKDKGSFKKNLSNFQNQGFISATQTEALKLVLEAGHATIHRNFKPEPYQVIAALDIVENIIESIYVNDVSKNNRLGDIPKRFT